MPVHMILFDGSERNNMRDKHRLTSTISFDESEIHDGGGGNKDRLTIAISFDDSERHDVRNKDRLTIVILFDGVGCSSVQIYT